MALSLDERHDLLDRFRSGPSAIRLLLRDAEPDARRFRPGPGTWCLDEIILHLTDAEAHSFVRLRHAVAEPDSSVTAWDQERWAERLRYERLDPELHLELFTYLRRASDALISDLRESDWAGAVHHPQYGRQTVEDLLRRTVDHTEKHLAQIQRALDAWRTRPTDG